MILNGSLSSEECLNRDHHGAVTENRCTQRTIALMAGCSQFSCLYVLADTCMGAGKMLLLTPNRRCAWRVTGVSLQAQYSCGG